MDKDKIRDTLINNLHDIYRLAKALEKPEDIRNMLKFCFGCLINWAEDGFQED